MQEKLNVTFGTYVNECDRFEEIAKALLAVELKRMIHFNPHEESYRGGIYAVVWHQATRREMRLNIRWNRVLPRNLITPEDKDIRSLPPWHLEWQHENSRNYDNQVLECVAI